jgi:cell surface protein SprA
VHINDGVRPEFLEYQTIKTGFSPLIGFNFTFKQIEGGNLTASFRLNKLNEYLLDPISAKITNNKSSDISINANYTKSGFTIPLFGLALQNDLTIGFSFTRKSNDPKLLEYISGIWNSKPQNGSITTNINPSIQYALSRSVTLMLFYNYTKTAPEEGNNHIPTQTSNEAGLNIKLTIQ